MESAGGRSDLRSLTREEEAIKRNTDCVYFLASPLTCKKGSECEYRHSEGVRVNPRDCKFWFSGNCLNPKCLFRHPPLDVPIGNPVANSGPNITSSLVSASMQLPMANSSAYNLSRNNVPCYYFQKGTCLKGDKCLFMHGPQPASNPLTKQTAKASVPITSQQNLSTAQIICMESAGKQVNGAYSSVESKLALENANVHVVHSGSSTSLSRPSNFVQFDRHHSNEQEAGEILGELSEVGYTKLKRPSNQQLQSSRYKNDKQVGEVFREFSPGFDVLVNNVVKVTDYLHEKDGGGSGSRQGGRTTNNGDGYGQHQCDVESAAWLDRDQRNGAGECQQYGKVQNGFDEEQQRNFSVSGRIFDKPILPVRRLAQRLRSPDGMDETDLRHRLVKQRRLNSSASASVSDTESKPYSRHEQKMQDRHAHNKSRDQQQLLPERTISSRLRGRITLSKPSFPEFASDLQGGGGRRRKRGSISPTRTLNLQGRLGERLSRRPIDDSSGNARNIGSQQKAKDGVNPLDFAGPRSLAELKGAKADARSQDQSTKNSHSISSLDHNRMKSLKPAGLQDSGVSVAFDGPKPLSALLKTNREEARPEINVVSSVSIDRKAIGEIEVGSFAFESAPVPELQSKDAFETSLEYTKAFTNPDEPTVGTVVEEEGEVGEEVVHVPAEVEQITYQQQQAAEDETGARDVAEDEDLYYADERDGEYDYETMDAGDYKTEDDENMDPMNTDYEDEDEDDFAKKIGLIFS